MKRTEKEWLEDFREFIDAEKAPVPADVSERILGHVKRDLNPSAWAVFARLLGIHVIVGTASLSICSQFGLNPFHTNFSLSDYFIKFGHSTCMLLCGTLFIGLTILLGSFLLRPEELKVLSRNAFLQIFGLSIFSLAAFIGFGADVVATIGFIWLAGAMIGGLAATKTVIRRPSFSN